MRIPAFLAGLCIVGLARYGSAQETEISAVEEPAPEPPGFFAETFGLPGKFGSKGEVAFENRAFQDDDNPATEDAGVGVLARVEWSHKHAAFEQKARVFGRLDALDKQRTVLIVEEAWLSAKRGRFRLKLGADIVNWTATEAFHPVDTINARNLDSDLENLEKRGEPMVMVQAGLLEGMTLQALYMPVYMRSYFPSPASRMSFVPPALLNDVGRRRTDRNGEFTKDDFGHQGALRLSYTLGSADLSVHVLENMDRYQPLVMVRLRDGRVVLVDQTVRQVGGTYTQAFGGLLVKVEGAYRMFLGSDDPQATALAQGLVIPFGTDRDHAAVAAGLEYGHTHDNGATSTFLLEGQGLFGPNKVTRERLNPFQRDVFLGYRLALGDEDDTTFMLGAIGDVEDFDELLGTASYQQRLGETWSVRAGVRLFYVEDPNSGAGLASLDQADHVRLTLIHHF